MARNSATPKQTVKTGGRVSRSKAKKADQATIRPQPEGDRQEAALAEWDEISDDMMTADIEVIDEKPAANQTTDAEARRRIEMLREERQLQQALSDVFAV